MVWLLTGCTFQNKFTLVMQAIQNCFHHPVQGVTTVGRVREDEVEGILGFQKADRIPVYKLKINPLKLFTVLL